MFEPASPVNIFSEITFELEPGTKLQRFINLAKQFTPDSEGDEEESSDSDEEDARSKARVVLEGFVDRRSEGGECFKPIELEQEGYAKARLGRGTATKRLPGLLRSPHRQRKRGLAADLLETPCADGLIFVHCAFQLFRQSCRL
mmetsp:Transcript_56933/g.163513  ORF Transcript_56933/g.163513 Transcript_56933/m.163513 type:complete len:144 (-) Transcript_56933:629-1060(-)